jgi:hypothetical protein
MKKASLSYTVLSGASVAQSGHGSTPDDLCRLIATYPASYLWLSSLPRSGLPLPSADLNSLAFARHAVTRARHARLDAFCFPLTYQKGTSPLAGLVRDYVTSDINFPLCISCEFGQDEDGSIVSGGDVSNECRAFIESLFPLFENPRYLRVNEKPLIVIYNYGETSRLRRLVEVFREVAIARGLLGLHIALVLSGDSGEALSLGVDALVEYPSELVPAAERLDTLQSVPNPETTTSTLYRGAKIKRETPPKFLSIGDSSSSDAPQRFGAWLRYLRAWTSISRPTKKDQFIFIFSDESSSQTRDGIPPSSSRPSYLEELARSSWVAASSPVRSIAEARDRLARDLYGLDAALRDASSPSARRYQGRSRWIHSLSNLLRPIEIVHRPARSLYRLVRSVGG